MCHDVNLLALPATLLIQGESHARYRHQGVYRALRRVGHRHACLAGGLAPGQCKEQKSVPQGFHGGTLKALAYGRGFLFSAIASGR